MELIDFRAMVISFKKILPLINPPRSLDTIIKMISLILSSITIEIILYIVFHNDIGQNLSIAITSLSLGIRVIKVLFSA